MITIPNIYGTCKGSEKAISLVEEIYEKEKQKDNPKKIYIFKEILHNKSVIEKFKKMGIETINDLSLVTDKDILIIRAHGESKEVIDYLENNNIECYNATCPNVSRIHKMVYDKYKEGYEIIIIGKKTHPEVIGTNGWCESKGIIIETEEDLENISSNKNKFIIGQTTFNKDKFYELVVKIKDIFEGCNIIVEDTLCPAVKNLINSGCEVAKDVDIMFVVGGKNSSNTKELNKSLNEFTKSYTFDNINAFYRFVINSELDVHSKIGLTGGASTPKDEIHNYKYLLEFLLFYKMIVKELKEKQDSVNDNLHKYDDHVEVTDLINDFCDLNKNGKYIRGTLIALGERLAKETGRRNYLPLAHAYEMFETSVLIHDDIIDNAKIRRGAETIPRRICKKYLNKCSTKEYFNDTLRLANSLGICAGDLGFYEANKLIVDSYSKNKNLSKILLLYNDIIIKTIKGEIIDVILPFKGKYNFKEITENDILDIYTLKTSWYTITGPFMLGYTLGGKTTTKEMETALTNIGIAFQIKDDLLGIFSDKNKIGKSNTSDIEEFKQTLLYSHVIKTEYKKEFLKYYGKKINESDLNKVRIILKESNTYNYINEYLDNIYDNTKKLIDELDLIDIGKDILKGLLIYIKIREK